MSKVLITGATGFVGRNLVRSLRTNLEVVGASSEMWDLRDQKACERMFDVVTPTIVIHAAGAVGGIAANKENPGKFMYENLAMGTHVIHECMRRGVSKLIMLGTTCGYPKFARVPFVEDELWSGYPEETNAPYGIAKNTLMKLVEVYHQQYGMAGVNLIPVNMYGAYDHFNTTSSHVIPALIMKVDEAIRNKVERITIWGTGNASREFLYAPDLARAIELAIEKDIAPVPINIGTGKETKISELVTLITRLMNYQGEVVYDSSKPEGQPRRCLDTSRARNLLEFEATTSLEEGLGRTIDWFFSQKNEGGLAQ